MRGDTTRRERNLLEECKRNDERSSVSKTIARDELRQDHFEAAASCQSASEEDHEIGSDAIHQQSRIRLVQIRARCAGLLCRFQRGIFFNLSLLDRCFIMFYYIYVLFIYVSPTIIKYFALTLLYSLA